MYLYVYRMDGVAEHGYVTFTPALEHGGSAIVEISLLDDCFGGVVQAGVYLLCPSFELLSQELDVRGSRLGVWRKRQEGVPLDSPAPHVRGDEVFTRADVHLRRHVWWSLWNNGGGEEEGVRAL